MNIRKTWAALPPKDRIRWLIVGTAITVALYGLLIFPFVNRDLTKSSALLARRIDRIEKRATVPQVDAASTATLQGRLSKLTKEKEALDARYQELAVRFVPDGNPEAHQALLLELNTLAQTSGIRMLQQGDERDKRGNARPLTDKESGRSYMRVLGTGDYWSLLAFLKGLSTLTHASAPLGLDLRSNADGKALEISLDVTL